MRRRRRHDERLSSNRAQARQGGQNSVLLSVCRLTISSDLAQQLPRADRYELGWDGGRRFVLEPGKNGKGNVRLHQYTNGGPLICTQRLITRFLREKLKAPETGTITLTGKMVDGVLMFGIMDRDIRPE